MGGKGLPPSKQHALVMEGAAPSAPELALKTKFSRITLDMDKTRFEWDRAKDRLNQSKHGLAFDVAQLAFADPKRLILIDLEHSLDEQRFYCLGRVGEGIVTVRFTYRDSVIRIIGAGYWRKGKKLYEEHHQIHE